MNLEAEYNNRGKVANHQEIRDGWARDTAAFRASHPFADLGVAYGPGARNLMDIFWPSAARGGKLAIFVHGGYWQSMDRVNFSHLAGGLLAHGVAVAMPSYDLCPEVTVAAVVEQVRDAAAFLARQRGGGMLALGHSAGGHLAAMLLATDWAARGLPPGTISAAMPISGLFDLPPLTHTSVNNALGMDEAEARRLSPLFYRPPGLPIHAIVGGDEGSEYTRQSRSIAEAWGGTWEALAGHNHFSIVGPLAGPDSAMVAKAVSLLGG